MTTVIIGAGPAGRAAASLLPEAILLSRPQVTVFHAEPASAGWRLWLFDGDAVGTREARRVVLAAPDLQLALAFGCPTEAWRPVVDARGRTGIAGIWACGALLGAGDPETAARHGRIVAADLLGRTPEGTIEAAPAAAPAPPRDADLVCDCLGLTWRDLRAAGGLTPAEIANLLHLRAGECRMRRCGPYLGPAFGLRPARPVPIMALARLAGDRPSAPPVQPAGGGLA